MTELDPTRGKKKSSSIMPEMERMVKQQERIKKQKERIQAQKMKRSHGHNHGHSHGQGHSSGSGSSKAWLTNDRLTNGELARRRVEQERLNAQDERIKRQAQAERKRALAARDRGEAVTGPDRAELTKVSREMRWSGKWNRRRAKMDHLARNYEIEE